MSGIASPVGAVLGAYFLMAIDQGATFRRSAMIGVRGALMIGLCVGYLLPGSRWGAPVFGAALAGALRTYRLVSRAAITAFRRGRDRTAIGHPLTLGGMGSGAGLVGAAVGALIT